MLRVASNRRPHREAGGRGNPFRLAQQVVIFGFLFSIARQLYLRLRREGGSQGPRPPTDHRGESVGDGAKLEFSDVTAGDTIVDMKYLGAPSA
jgi:hypothetical protein